MLSREEQDLEIRIAIASASSGDPWEMVVHLQRAKLLVAMKRSFWRKWPSLSEADVDDLVAVAVEALYGKLKRGDEVANPVGYMLEVMRHEAYDLAHERSLVTGLDEDSIVPTDSENGFSQLSEERRDGALQLAREFLPKLGQTSIQTVMGLILDAVEDGRGQVATAELSAATGLTEETVRQCRSRGFRRLERLAREAGMIEAPNRPVRNGAATAVARGEA